MKINIEVDKDVGIESTVYKLLLHGAIEHVLGKIGENCDDITWRIFVEDTDKINNNFADWDPHSLMSVVKKYRYGFCNINTKEIWISTRTIKSMGDLGNRSNYASYFNPIKENLWVNVILDELTHIKTKKDHRNRIYDSQLKAYKQKYYFGRSSFPM